MRTFSYSIRNNPVSLVSACKSLLATCVFVVTACQTTPPSSQPAATAPLSSGKNPAPQDREQTASGAAEEKTQPIVTQFKTALAKKDCSLIRELESRLISAPDTYATSVTLAITWCAHKKSPQDAEALKKFLTTAEDILKNEVPYISSGFIEQLKAESHLAAGDSQSARAAFSKSMSLSALQFMSLVSGPALRLELQTIETMLTPAQANVLKDIRESLANPATQASSITKMDSLLAQVGPGSTYDRLLSARLMLFTALELSFASQLTTLEDLRLRNDAAALAEFNEKLRKLFPSKAHHVRIDVIVGSQFSGKQEVVDSSAAAGNQCATLTPADILNSPDKSNISPDKAMQIAKVSLNDGRPADAVEILDSLSETNKNEKTRALRREASEAHVKDLRRKASEIYRRVSLSTDPQTKLDNLSQCKQILENILARYPETDSFTKRNIQKFLNSVVDNIAELRKVQSK